MLTWELSAIKIYLTITVPIYVSWIIITILFFNDLKNNVSYFNTLNSIVQNVIIALSFIPILMTHSARIFLLRIQYAVVQLRMKSQLGQLRWNDLMRDKWVKINVFLTRSNDPHSTPISQQRRKFVINLIWNLFWIAIILPCMIIYDLELIQSGSSSSDNEDSDEDDFNDFIPLFWLYLFVIGLIFTGISNYSLKNMKDQFNISKEENFILFLFVIAVFGM